MDQKQNNIINQQPISNEEFLRDFIGNNYAKITTRTFNFAGFFFTGFYMFYRKMFLYSILLFFIYLIVLNITNSFIVLFVINVVVGFLVNKVYLHYAKNKIEKIRIRNSEKDVNKIKAICSSKGGTSIGKVLLGFIVELCITLVILVVMIIAGIGSIIVGIVGEIFDYSNWNITINDNKNIEYKMKYINPDESLNLTNGNSYNVTFEVIEDTIKIK